MALRSHFTGRTLNLILVLRLLLKLRIFSSLKLAQSFFVYPQDPYRKVASSLFVSIFCHHISLYINKKTSWLFQHSALTSAKPGPLVQRCIFYFILPFILFIAKKCPLSIWRQYEVKLIFSHGFCGSGIWKYLRWTVLTQNLPSGYSQDVSGDCSSLTAWLEAENQHSR